MYKKIPIRRFRTEYRLSNRFILMMKLIVFLTLLNIHSVVATGYTQRITIASKQILLEDVFREIRKQSGYNIIVGTQLLNEQQKIDLNLQNATVEEALHQSLKGQPLSYEIRTKNIIIKPAPSVKEKQERLLQGQVRDEQGQPVIGASITIKGELGKSTKTNDRGIFSLEVAQGQIITVSFVGFEKQEIGIRNQQHLQITLLQEQTGVDEVVVIGYGTQKRSNVIAPVSTMQADGIEERPITRVDQALVGQMAGVHVKQTTGVPGKGFSVQVRGSGSITAGREPLYVLDGFPLAVNSQNSNGGYTNGNPLDNINPNDIESIQVLKDASAAAIYGSRASNGVVLITTKQGKAGVPKINVNAFSGISKA